MQCVVLHNQKISTPACNPFFEIMHILYIKVIKVSGVKQYTITVNAEKHKFNFFSVQEFGTSSEPDGAGGALMAQEEEVPSRMEDKDGPASEAKMVYEQDWELAQQFFEQIAHFLQAKE